MKRNIRSLILSALTLSLLLTACGVSGDGGSSGEKQQAYQKITAEDAALIMGSEDVLVVDVRRADEYEAGHIPGAINLPNEEIDGTEPPALPNKDARLILYCRTGVRSKEAAEKLKGLGYTNISDMGGIVDWPYDTVTGSDPGEFTMPETPGILSSFSTKDLDGNAVDQSILDGYDLTMVNVWATYCGYCIDEMPELNELSEEYAEKGVRVVGLVVDVLDSDGSYSDSQLETAREIVSATGTEYLHLLPSEDLYGILASVPAMPTTFFVDGDGRQVGKAYAGAKSKPQWAAILDETLKGVQP